MVAVASGMKRRDTQPDTDSSKRHRRDSTTSAEPGPARQNPKLDRRARNKLAAEKYRKKKRAESLAIVDEVGQLKADNAAQAVKIAELQEELDFVHNLLRRVAPELMPSDMSSSSLKAWMNGGRAADAVAQLREAGGKRGGGSGKGQGKTSKKQLGGGGSGSGGSGGGGGGGGASAAGNGTHGHMRDEQQHASSHSQDQAGVPTMHQGVLLQQQLLQQPAINLQQLMQHQHHAAAAAAAAQAHVHAQQAQAHAQATNGSHNLRTRAGSDSDVIPASAFSSHALTSLMASGAVSGLFNHNGLMHQPMMGAVAFPVSAQSAQPSFSQSNSQHHNPGDGLNALFAAATMARPQPTLRRSGASSGRVTKGHKSSHYATPKQRGPVGDAPAPPLNPGMA